MAVVTAIMIAGAYVRLTGLTCLPPGLYPDEAMNTTDGLITAEAGSWKLFYENNNGREGLYISFLGYLLHWFGSSLWIVRFLPALIGTLTLPAVFWLGRRASGRFGGIIALGLMAFSYWHLNFSRIGFRAILMVFMLSWSFAFLAEGFWRLFYRRKLEHSTFPWIFFAVGGLFLGLSLHTYIAVRIAPLVVITLWAMALIFFGSFRKDILKSLLITILFAIIAAAPMLYDFTVHRDHFSSRTSNVSIFSSPNVGQALGKSVLLTLASFLAYGDQNWRHNYPYLPLLLPWWGVILFIGVGQGLIKLIKLGTRHTMLLLGRKNKKISEKQKWEIVILIFLIAWWAFLLAPSILTNEGLPHALRSIGAIPPTFLLIGFTLDKWSKSIRIKAVFYVLVALTAIFNVYVYFYLWGKNPAAYSAFEYRLSGIGIYLRETIPQEPDTNFYLVTNADSFHTDANLPVMVEPIRFFTWQYRDRLHFVLPENFDLGSIKLPAKIFLVQNENDTFSKIASRYPNALFEKIKMGEEIDNDGKNTANFAPTGEECFLWPPIKLDTYFSFIDIPQ